jgi:hypothetical protein
MICLTRVESQSARSLVYLKSFRCGVSLRGLHSFSLAANYCRTIGGFEHQASGDGLDEKI